MYTFSRYQQSRFVAGLCQSKSYSDPERTPFLGACPNVLWRGSLPLPDSLSCPFHTQFNCKNTAKWTQMRYHFAKKTYHFAKMLTK